ncbi:hypothetical protein SPX_08440 [Sporomusa paucivorans]
MMYGIDIENVVLWMERTSVALNGLLILNIHT